MVLINCTTTRQPEAEGFRGTVLTSNAPAPGFELTDHLGKSADLFQYNDGNVVLLTFLYTYCPDICPIVTFKIKSIHTLLGTDAKNVSIVAISVDPERDTVERAYEYSEDWGMTDKWSFLVGTESQLESVWASYFVSSVIDDSHRPSTVSHLGEVPDVKGVDALSRDIALRYTVNHQAPLYLIDRDGVMRVLHTLPIDPEEVVDDLQVLLD